MIRSSLPYQPLKPEMRFTGKADIATKSADLIVNNKHIQDVFSYAGKNPSLVNSAFVFLLSTTLRPATIMLTPTNKEDKKYSAVRSIATGIADLAISTAFYVPLKTLTDKAILILKEKGNTVYKNNPETLKAFNTIVNRGSRFVVMPLQVILLFSLMPLILNMFPKPNKNGK